MPLASAAGLAARISITSGTLFASHKLPLRCYLAAIAIFCNEVKGKSALALSRDLNVSYKCAFVLLHKLREAMAEELKGRMIGGDGEVAEVDGGYFGGYIKPANYRENRRDRRLLRNQNGKRNHPPLSTSPTPPPPLSPPCLLPPSPLSPLFLPPSLSPSPSNPPLTPPSIPPSTLSLTPLPLLPPNPLPLHDAPLISLIPLSYPPPHPPPKVVVVVGERDGSSLPAVFHSEGHALDFIRRRVLKGTTINADEAG